MPTWHMRACWSVRAIMSHRHAGQNSDQHFDQKGMPWPGLGVVIGLHAFRPFLGVDADRAASDTGKNVSGVSG
jgi:hypothetical protein